MLSERGEAHPTVRNLPGIMLSNEKRELSPHVWCRLSGRVRDSIRTGENRNTCSPKVVGRSKIPLFVQFTRFAITLMTLLGLISSSTLASTRSPSPSASGSASPLPTTSSSPTRTGTSTPNTTSSAQASYVSMTPSSIPEQIPITPIGFFRQRLQTVSFCGNGKSNSDRQDIAAIAVEERVVQSFPGGSSIFLSKPERLLQPGEGCFTLTINAPNDQSTVGKILTMAKGKNEEVYVFASVTAPSSDSTWLLATKTKQGRTGSVESEPLYVIDTNGDECSVAGDVLAYAFTDESPTLAVGLSDCSSGTDESPQAAITSIDSALASNATIVKTLPVFNPLFASSPDGKYALTFDRTKKRPVAFVCGAANEFFTECTTFRLYLDDLVEVHAVNWISGNFILFYGVGRISNTTVASVANLKNFPEGSSIGSLASVIAEKGSVVVDLSLADGISIGRFLVRSSTEAHLADTKEGDVALYLVGSTETGKSFALAHMIEDLRFSDAEDIGFRRDLPWIVVLCSLSAALILLSGVCIFLVVKLVKRKAPKPSYSQPTDQTFKDQTGRNMESFRKLGAEDFQCPVNPLALHTTKIDAEKTAVK